MCPVRDEGGERRVNIVGVPVGDGCCCRSRGWCHEGAVHYPQFVLVRTDAELGVGARAGLRTAVIRSGAQYVCVPARGGVGVISGKNHRGESLQDGHGVSFR